MPLPQQPVYGSSLASISPQVPVSQVGSWPLVLLPLYFFQETKFVKSISSDSGIRTTFSSFCLSTGNYMACSVWSNLIVLPFAHSTQSVSSGWVFFLVFILSSSWIQRNSGTGSLEALSGSLNVFFVKFGPVTSLTSPKWSSIRRMSWNYRSRKKKLPQEPVNISSFLVLKSLISNGIPSHWPGNLGWYSYSYRIVC